jgi:uncharacterized membrane protein (UPF0127 family)
MEREMTLERTPENLHAAAMIRLQVLYTALQGAIVTLARAVPANKADPNYEDRLEVLQNARAALAIADGKSTEIPDGLRRSRMLTDEGMTRRFLAISAEG